MTKQEIKQRMFLISVEIGKLGHKVDSGRHTGADVQRLHRHLAEYFELERELVENQGNEFEKL